MAWSAGLLTPAPWPEYPVPTTSPEGAINSPVDCRYAHDIYFNTPVALSTQRITAAVVAAVARHAPTMNLAIAHVTGRSRELVTARYSTRASRSASRRRM